MPELVRVIGKAFLKEGKPFLQVENSSFEISSGGSQLKEGAIYRIVGTVREDANTVDATDCRELAGFDLHTYLAAMGKKNSA
ncbi:hypothetical protein HY995_05505 [Candidatus Micrarchaeota archaeon]|nr:hypothetical protein [Candidatus Micrarchaeota archaeon]MBI5177511.1 hypothetical protein [Candidatus Micrarchaeota archaeon]